MPSLTRARSIILWSLAALALLLVLARVMLPYTIQYGFSHWFQQHDIDASITGVSLELGNGSILLSGISGKRDGEHVFKLESIGLAWSWSDVFDHDARLLNLSVDGLDVAARQVNADKLVVAGIELGGDDAGADTQPPGEAGAADQEPVDWRVMLDELLLSDIRLCYSTFADANIDYCNDIDKLRWQGELRYDLASATPDTALTAAGDFAIDGLRLHNNHLDRTLLAFDRFAIDGLQLASLAEISIDALGLRALAVMQREADGRAGSITALDEVSVERLSLADMNTLRIDTVTITDHAAHLLNRKDKTLEFSDWLPAATGDEPEADTADVADPDQGPAFNYAVGRFVYRTEQPITYSDDSLASPFSVTLTSMTLEVDAIDSTQPETPSTVSFQAQYEEHGKITLGGTATPLSAKPSFDIDGTLSGIDLRKLSAFTQDAIGYSIRSGQLDSTLKLKADRKILDSNLGLELHQLELKPVSKQAESDMNTSMGFPLNTSLSLLKDRDNSVRLDIPITGDLDKPDFDPGDVITKATSEAITFAVINYYTPFGLVMAADGLFSLATALSFDPVLFAAAGSEIDSAAGGQLDKLASLMQERPGIRVTLCGYTTPADAAAMLPARKPDDAGKLPPLTAEQIEALSALAEGRANTIKQRVTGAGVDASRLVLCAPEHETDADAAGRVEISI